MKNLPQQLKGIALTTVFFIGLLYVQAWTGAPVGTPPANNVAAPINVGDTEQTKGGSVIFNGTFNPLRIVSSWTGYTLNGAGGSTNHAEIANDTGTYKALMIAGNKSEDGITRKVKLYDDVDVLQNLSAVSGIFSSSVKIGNTLTSCSASNAGSIRFNAGVFEGCNGTSWDALSGTGSGSCPKVGGRYQLTIPSSVTSYSLYNAALACGGINLLVSQDFTVTISTGVTVGPMTISGLANGSTVKIINNGKIIGVGGSGGADINPSTWMQNPGGAGGDAIYSTVPLIIDNATGLIGGGGGGGGAGVSGVGGGGGAGFPPGFGGKGVDSYVGWDGQNGTETTGGAACCSWSNMYASNGGNLGQAGQSISAAGGAAGYAVRTNGKGITWVTVGDVRGSTN